MTHRLTLLLAGMIGVLFLVGFVLARPVLAQPSCTEAVSCVLVPGVQRSASPAGTTRYVLTNETTGTIQVQQRFFDANTSVLTVTTGLPPSWSQNYYAEWPGLPVPFSGTLAISATGRVTAQVIGPTATCPLPVTDECLTIFVSDGASTYTIRNTEAMTVTYGHQVVVAGAVVATFVDAIGPFSSKTYDAENPPSPLGQLVRHLFSWQQQQLPVGWTGQVVIRADQPFDVTPQVRHRRYLALVRR